MGASMRNRVERLRAYATTRLASTALVLLATPIALTALPDVAAAADSALPAHVELAGGITGYPVADNAPARSTFSTPGVLSLCQPDQTLAIMRV